LLVPRRESAGWLVRGCRAANRNAYSSQPWTRSVNCTDGQAGSSLCLSGSFTMKSARWIFLTCVLVAGFAAAQETGQITGTVRDSSGANIVKAQVTVSSPERGINRVTQTNNDGEYLVSALPPGIYDLTISAPGFKTY